MSQQHIRFLKLVLFLGCCQITNLPMAGVILRGGEIAQALIHHQCILHSPVFWFMEVGMLTRLSYTGLDHLAVTSC